MIAALIVGFSLTLATQDFILGPVSEAITGQRWKIAFTYAMPIATIGAFLVCILGRSPRHAPRS